MDLATIRETAFIERFWFNIRPDFMVSMEKDGKMMRDIGINKRWKEFCKLSFVMILSVGVAEGFVTLPGLFIVDRNECEKNAIYKISCRWMRIKLQPVYVEVSSDITNFLFGINLKLSMWAVKSDISEPGIHTIHTHTMTILPGTVSIKTTVNNSIEQII